MSDQVHWTLLPPFFCHLWTQNLPLLLSMCNDCALRQRRANSEWYNRRLLEQQREVWKARCAPPTGKLIAGNCADFSAFRICTIINILIRVRNPFIWLADSVVRIFKGFLVYPLSYFLNTKKVFVLMYTHTFFPIQFFFLNVHMLYISF